MKRLATQLKIGAVLAALVCTALATSGCEDPVAPPPPPTAPKAKKGKGGEATTAEPTAAGETTEYIRPEYPNASRRNPFQPDPDVVVPTATVSEGEVRTREPLEQFGLGQLTLIAIISETAVPKAMFLDTDGFGHVVKEGDRIGRNGGVVSDIRDNEVEVLEGGDEEDGQTFQRILKLREVELRSNAEDGLTQDEREALERLLETEAGRTALERQFQQNAAGATAAEQQNNQPAQPATSKGVDPRYRGFAPPQR